MTSTLRDAETWFSAFACGGQVNGRRLLKPETVEEMLTPRVAVRRNGIHPQRWVSRYEANFVSYGLGWYAHDFAGRRINEHTGALEGFLVLGCSVPSERIAVVIYTNQHQSAAINPLRYLLLAHAFGIEQKDWDARFKAFAGEAKRAPQMINGEPSTVSGFSRRLPLTWPPQAKAENQVSASRKVEVMPPVADSASKFRCGSRAAR